MSDQKSKQVRRLKFGIRQKVGLAIGLIVVVISAISFSLAVYLHISLSLNSAIKTNLYSGKMIMSKLDPELVTRYFEEGTRIYESIPEEIRADRQSEEYLSYFAPLDAAEYEPLKNTLKDMATFEDLKWLDLRFADFDNERWVYLMDTDPKGDGRFHPGYWERADEAVATFRESTPEEDLADEAIWKPLLPLLDMEFIDLKKQHRFSTTTEFHHLQTGEVIGYVGTGELFEDYQDELSAFWILHLIALIFFLIVVFAVSGYAADRWLVRPLLKLTAAAADYVADTDKAHNTRYFDRVQIRSKDELQLLKDSMVNMEEDLARYVRDISRMTAEKERESVEMELSARIQTSLLPQTLENYTGERSFAVSALIHPAKMVGGDFYDYYVIDDDHIAITVADVSDKGVPAAMFMIVAKTFLKTAGGTNDAPADVMKKVNSQLYDQNQEMMFVTVFFGIYTISERKLVYVNAGHEELALYQKKEGRFALKKEEHDFVMAITPDAEFTERTLYLEEGDKLFLYTDGVPEAKNASDEMFGEERMIDALNALSDLSGDKLLQRMREQIRAFEGGAPQFDDVTMLLLEITAV